MAVPKADIASAGTVALSGLGLWLHNINGWVNEYMPLITAFGIVSGTLLTAWYYWQSIEQRKRDRAVQHKQMAHDKHMAGVKDDQK